MVLVQDMQTRDVRAAATDSAVLHLSGQMDMRKVTTPLLLHMLRNEFRFPLLFNPPRRKDIEHGSTIRHAA
jgi:hypothetical protein